MIYFKINGTLILLLLNKCYNRCRILINLLLDKYWLQLSRLITIMNTYFRTTFLSPEGTLNYGSRAFIAEHYCIIDFTYLNTSRMCITFRYILSQLYQQCINISNFTKFLTNWVRVNQPLQNVFKFLPRQCRRTSIFSWCHAHST